MGPHAACKCAGAYLKMIVTLLLFRREMPGEPAGPGSTRAPDVHLAECNVRDSLLKSRNHALIQRAAHFNTVPVVPQRVSGDDVLGLLEARDAPGQI
jgi:hypothetical protein